MNESWHTIELNDLFNKFNSSSKGITNEEAKIRLEKYGFNRLERTQKVSPLKIFLSQFKGFLVIILIIAALISYAIGFFPGQEPHTVDVILILAILFFNAVFGFLQDYKAEKSIEALQKLSNPKAKVLRNGIEMEINSEEIVPGDIILLEEGMSVPADARIIQSFSLKIDESSLTGESVSVQKINKVLKKELSVAEKHNMVFMGTTTATGRGLALVVNTGMRTEVGKIATNLQETIKRDSPFQSEIDDLGKKIGLGVLGIILIVAVIQFFFSGLGLIEVMLTSISLAVAAVPEGLPAVVTLALAIGVRKMSKKNSLVRALPVVESLGSVNVICTDKTGTLTEGKMSVVKAFSGLGEINLVQKNYSFDNNIKLFESGLLCNNARFGINEKNEKSLLGDPTETSLISSALEFGLNIEEIPFRKPRVFEFPFSSERKMMTTVHKDGSKKIVYSKGAPEKIIEKCTHILINGKIEKLSTKYKNEILIKNNEFASSALRVLGFAFKENPKSMNESDVENGLIFLGLQAMIDKPRIEVKQAIQDCRDAGIKVVMITGDNALTAQAIGKELGFKGIPFLGSVVETLSIEELSKIINETEIFARVDPLHKVKILEAFQKKGFIVAMTGDGVNDAPALKKSDVGISMGLNGTDVAKQASDMILLDDNFVSIRDSIEEGRGIFDNIRKFVNYLLTANAGEVMAVFFASLLGFGLPFTAVHLLWINLLTDGLPAIALGVDPIAENIMKRKPRPKNEGVIDEKMMYSIIIVGFVLAFFVLWVFSISLENIIRAQTLAFTAIVIFELTRVQMTRVFYGTKFFSNKWLWLSLSVSILLQLIILYSPLNTFFKVVPLGLNDWLLIIAGLIGFSVVSFVALKLFVHGKTS